MEEELSLDNILDSAEIDTLFTENDIQETPSDTPEGENKEVKEETTEINPNDLFGESESVGSEEDNIEEKESTTPSNSGTSPNTYIYSSIAKALKEEGVFPDLDDDTANKIKAPEDFRNLIEEQIKAGLDERQKRIDAALGVGVEPSEINKYENTIAYLNNIADSAISDESDNGENLRKQLIFQDFINRGYSKERANREVTKSLNAGTDIEDAREALNSNKEFFQEQYNNLIEDAKAKEEKTLQERQVQIDNLKKSILEDKSFFGDVSVDKSTRQRIYDNIIRPVYKDPNSGNYYTALQKYEMENRSDFIKNVGLLYTLTNGFKDINNLVKSKVNKEMKKGLRELEATLNNSTVMGGNLKFVSNTNDDPESFIGKGWNLDI